MNKNLAEKLAKWRDDVAAQQRANEKVQADHKRKLDLQGENQTKHREMIEEHKHQLNTN